MAMHEARWRRDQGAGRCRVRRHGHGRGRARRRPTTAADAAASSAHGHCHQQAQRDDRGEDRRLDEGQVDAGRCQRRSRAAIIATKAAGTSHSARPPICAAQRPTATMARIWSRPKSGCEKPAVKRAVLGRVEVGEGRCRGCQQHEPAASRMRLFICPHGSTGPGREPCPMQILLTGSILLGSDRLSIRHLAVAPFTIGASAIRFALCRRFRFVALSSPSSRII